MIRVMVKVPHQEPVVVEIKDASALSELLEGDYELVHDDKLDDFHLVVNEEARGIQANNFPISSEGFLDWVYGPCVFVRTDGSSLTDDDVQIIVRYLVAK